MKKPLVFLLIIICLNNFSQCVSGDCQNGFGTYTWLDGDKYVGDWIDGKFHGKGTYTMSDGDKYVGDWIDDKKTGQGTYTWSNGDEYVGDWIDSKRNGQGTWTNLDGDKFIGTFQEDKRVSCTFFTKSGVNVFTSDWQNESRLYVVSWPQGDNYSFTRSKGKLNLDFNKIITSYVNYKVNEWQMKGEFEKIADYNVRVNEASKNKIIEKFQNLAIVQLESAYQASINFKNLILSKYDAENETFLLSSNDIGEFVLNVPIDKAPFFKQNFNTLEFKDKDFILIDNKFILSALKIIDKEGNEYNYNKINSHTYNQTKIDQAPVERKSNFNVSIGDTYQGGIVFYLDGKGGGLIAAPLDQGLAEWGCYGTTISGAYGTEIGTGAQNTYDIVNANCSTETSGNSIAANICANLTLGGYSDWFLPSKDELNLMWKNLADLDGDGVNNGVTDSNNLGSFAESYFWSSTQVAGRIAWSQNFSNGIVKQNYLGKYDYSGHFRAIRAF